MQHVRLLSWRAGDGQPVDHSQLRVRSLGVCGRGGPARVDLSVQAREASSSIPASLVTRNAAACALPGDRVSPAAPLRTGIRAAATRGAPYAKRGPQGASDTAPDVSSLPHGPDTLGAASARAATGASLTRTRTDGNGAARTSRVGVIVGENRTSSTASFSSMPPPRVRAPHARAQRGSRAGWAAPGHGNLPRVTPFRRPSRLPENAVELPPVVLQWGRLDSSFRATDPGGAARPEDAGTSDGLR
jgi:hypothetical protein